ncbi:hypothetical protein [Nocardioides sp. zg-1228]|uniref:hypothetical protein n=1 Tax=Nocardioides sp. zg-1228 TaxID=2763008 RepID=UPI0016429FC8|nr:hypothetical protein [Nocardioides sp. zg-1228]MBC2931631.1 hypothetical protein [Nocardioides sp. zg-1228]QSF57224.1 hypothetical protein JX575_16940 [Nocardioides sp. zg-1228]
MPEPTRLEFAQGPRATRAVALDPFWATVMRRHGDVDLVVLPPEPPRRADVPADEPAVDPVAARDDLRARMAALWAALGLEGEPAHLDDTWFAGSEPGTLRWQGTATFDDLDPVVASAALGRAQQLLAEADGWHVLAPPDGIPRVLAGRPGRFGREDVQVLVPTTARVVVRVRSALVVVGEDAAAAAVGGDAG